MSNPEGDEDPGRYELGSEDQMDAILNDPRSKATLLKKMGRGKRSQAPDL